MKTKRPLDPRTVALRQIDAQTVECPRCRALTGVPCRSLDTKPISYHAERYARFRDGW